MKLGLNHLTGKAAFDEQNDTQSPIRLRPASLARYIAL